MFAESCHFERQKNYLPREAVQKQTNNSQRSTAKNRRVKKYTLKTGTAYVIRARVKLPVFVDSRVFRIKNESTSGRGRGAKGFFFFEDAPNYVSFEMRTTLRRCGCKKFTFYALLAAKRRVARLSWLKTAKGSIPLILYI